MQKSNMMFLKNPCICKGFMISFQGRKKARTWLSETVPVKKKRLVSRTYTGAEVKKPIGGKKHERYFNEAAFRSRCSLWTSDKKMEP